MSKAINWMFRPERVWATLGALDCFRAMSYAAILLLAAATLASLLHNNVGIPFLPVNDTLQTGMHLETPPEQIAGLLPRGQSLIPHHPKSHWQKKSHCSPTNGNFAGRALFK